MTWPSVGHCLAQAQARGLPRLEARWLLAQALAREPTWLLTHDEHPLTAVETRRWSDWLARRLDGVPLAYLSGRHEFHGLVLSITPDVLDPRPDTETLVDWALEHLAAQPPGARVLDLGTGSGAIALALKHRRPDAQVSAVDLSPAALAVARGNGERLNLPVRWLLGRWFEPVADERFDLIVSNPPYIRDDDPHLPALHHEPRLALTAGSDGLDALRDIVRHAGTHLTRGAPLLLEHGHEQGANVAALLQAQRYQGVAQRRDLPGHVRCTGGHWPG
ncbi:MAG: peptide chain release factor N(5)-glutamine methyltransferase [Burkholderiales bacterium]